MQLDCWTCYKIDAVPRACVQSSNHGATAAVITLGTKDTVGRLPLPLRLWVNGRKAFSRK